MNGMSQQDRNRYNRQDAFTQRVITDCMMDFRRCEGMPAREAWHWAIRLRAAVK